MARSLTENFLGPLKVKVPENRKTKGGLAHSRNFDIFENPMRAARVNGFYSKIFSTCAMTSILFSTHFLESGQRFENKQNGQNCYRKIFKAA